MVNNISDVTNKIIDLDTAIVNNVDAMNEVNNGTCESANAIQNQLLKTKQIQNNIDEVKDASITIQNDVNKAVSDINNGQELITLLKRVTHHCEDDGKLVADELNRFKEYTSKMNSIIDLITNVATQTSLLSLNASIEAARAGEAGKGFAVVATEISDLANQTTSATDDITSLINNISNELQIMIDTIDKLLEGNKAQIKHVEETSLSFTKITSNINTIQEKSRDLINVVKSLEISNTAIIESIQTVSSITEEVAAHSNETLNSSEQNKDVVSNIKSIIEDLNESANNLNNI